MLFVNRPPVFLSAQVLDGEVTKRGESASGLASYLRQKEYTSRTSNVASLSTPNILIRLLWLERGNYIFSVDRHFSIAID